MNRRLIHALTGLFLIAAILLLVFTVASGPTLRRLLAPGVEVETWLPGGYLSPGNPVTFRSYRVGTVVEIEPRFWEPRPDHRWFRVSFTIDRAYAAAITDRFRTTYSLSPLGGLGSAELILLAPGEEPGGERSAAVLVGTPLSQREPDAPPLELELVEPQSLIELATRQLKDLADRTMPMVNEIVGEARGVVATAGRITDDVATIVERFQREDGELFTTVRGVQALVARLQALTDPVATVLDSTLSLMRSIEAGDGVAGALLRDPQLRNSVARTIEELEGTLKDARRLLAEAEGSAANVRVATEALPELAERARAIAGRLDTASRSLPGAAEDVRQALIEANRLLEALQNHWLIRGSVAPEAESAPLVPPAAAAPPGAAAGGGG